MTLAMTACWFAYAHHHPHAVQFAYIGPGSGFAFISSFLTLIVGFFASLLSFLDLAISHGLAHAAAA